jgi:chromosome segregation ATPase
VTLAGAEVAISILKEGYAKLTETVENLKDKLSESRSAQEKLAGKLEEVVARHDQKLTETSIALALLKKDVDDLKGHAEEARKYRWALFIAVFSAVLSLGSALFASFVKRS